MTNNEWVRERGDTLLAKLIGWKRSDGITVGISGGDFDIARDRRRIHKALKDAQHQFAQEALNAYELLDRSAIEFVQRYGVSSYPEWLHRQAKGV